MNSIQSLSALANLSKKPREEWKEEIHDKLYEERQVHLEMYKKIILLRVRL